MALGDATFDGLVREHDRALRRLATGLVGPELAEDVVQETFLRAWQHRTRFRSEAAPATWLHSIARNLCVDHLRRRVLPAVAPLDGAAAIPDPAPPPDVALAAAEARHTCRRALVAALDALPAADRHLLALREVDRCSYLEIARRLELNPRTVATRLHRSRVRLRSLMVARLGAALVAALLLLALGARPSVQASVGAFLRQVVVREDTPAGEARLVSLPRRTLDQAQRGIDFPIRQPSVLPLGYRLVDVQSAEIHRDAVGPSVLLDYARGDAHLIVLQLRASGPVAEDVAAGAARTVPVGGGTGLLIDGRWVDRPEGRSWRPGTMLRLIVERGDVVLQLQVDPRDGWTAESLAEVAASIP